MNLDEFGIVESLILLITGLIVVFAMLVVLIVIIKVFGSAIHGLEKGKKDKAPAQEKVQMAAAPAVQKVQPVAKPAVEAGIPGEVVAAIAAAVACLEGNETGYQIRNIRRAAAVRPVWSAAGLAENTRPF